MSNFVRRWFFQIAYSDYLYIPFDYSGLWYLQYTPRLLLNYYLVQRTIFTSFLIVFPVCFYAVIRVHPVITEYDSFAGIITTVLLIWFLYFYFMAAWWYLFKRKCDKVKNRGDIIRVKKSMKRMIKLLPYCLSAHGLFLLLLNILILAYIKLELIPVVYWLVIGIPVLVLEIDMIYNISYRWIRAVTYPLRNHRIREIIRNGT